MYHIILRNLYFIQLFANFNFISYYILTDCRGFTYLTDFFFFFHFYLAIAIFYNNMYYCFYAKVK